VRRTLGTEPATQEPRPQGCADDGEAGQKTTGSGRLERQRIEQQIVGQREAPQGREHCPADQDGPQGQRHQASRARVAPVR
jgi:hypothetical protein